MAITRNTFFKRRCRQTVLAHPLDPPPDVAQNRDRDRSVLHRWTGPSFRIGSIMLHSDASPPSEAISQCKGQDRAFEPLWNPSTVVSRRKLRARCELATPGSLTFCP